MFIGCMLEMDGLRNTALVYACLFALCKFNEFYFSVASNIYVYIFFTCALLFFIAYELSKNPEFVISIFINEDEY